MHELISEAIALVNLPFTILFGFVLGYWGLVIIGVLDLDGLDLDWDVDADGGLWQGIGHFFHADEGPFMAVASLLLVFLWFFAMLLNHYLNPSHSWLLAGGLLIPNLFVSVIGTKMVVFPVYRLLRKLNATEEPAEVPLMGAVCQVITSRADHECGQAEIERTGAPIKLTVRTSQPDEVLVKGDSAVIFSEDKENNIYFIKKLED